MEPLRIGLISDTHGLLRNQAKRVLQSCEQIIHAGDIDNPKILKEIKKIAPTTVVRGNMDLGRWAHPLKHTEQLELGQWSILVVHNLEHLDPFVSGANLVIHGHTHRFQEQRKNGILLLNPGSAGPLRFDGQITMAVLTLGERAAVEKIVLKGP